MKKIMALIISIAMIICAVPITAFATDDEVPEGYIGVYDIEDLYSIRYDLDKNYILMADIDMTEDTAPGGLYDSGYGWKPICDGETPFSGIFDGNGHTIKGMQITGAYGDYTGLFGIATGDFKDLYLDDISIINQKSCYQGSYVGGLVGYGIGCSFDNIDISGEIQLYSLQNNGCVGSLVGYEKGDFETKRYGSFKNIISDVSIILSLKNYHNICVGGIIGNVTGCIISYDDFSTTSASNLVYKGSISANFECTCVESSITFYVGGIAGNSYLVAFNKCCNQATLTATYNVEGYMYDGASFTSKQKIYIAGISGYCQTRSGFDDCKNEGNISGTVIAERCFYESHYKYHFISGYSYTSGIANCYNDTDNPKANIKNCYNNGAISSKVDNAFNRYIYAAGISTDGANDNCYNLGTILSSGNNDSHYSGSYYGGKSKETIIISSGISSLGDVDTSINFGQITPNGTAISTGKISNSYYLFGTAKKGNVNEDDTNSTAISLTAQQIKNKGFLTNLDFENTWFIDLKSGIEHPQLISNPEIEHVHKFVAKVTEPKCTTKGYTTYTCECGESYISDYVDETGHNFGIWSIKEEPTCQKEGTLIRYCSECEEFEEVPVNKVEHKYIEIVTEPTCTKAGYTTHRCVYCGDEYVDTPVPAKEHKMTVKTITPTCTQNGCDIHICSECGYNYFDNEVNAKGHTPVTVNAVSPTAGKDGYTGDIVCSECEELLEKGEVIHYSHGVHSVAIDDVSLNYKGSTTITPKIEVDSGVEYTVKWESSDTKVATVDDNGKVTATKRGSGSATIICTVTDQYGNTVTDDCKVTVSLSSIQWIIVYLLFGWLWY